jgi:hypothetical protein
MQLICKCGASQPVSVADEADEDRRTQGIRQAFRAEHATSCGPRSVTLQIHDTATQGPEIDFTPQPWMTSAPGGISLNGDGFFYTTLERDGQPQQVRVCEDCWSPIPRYVDFPLGLTSPESDGAKLRATHVESKAGFEHLMKAVCVPCYRLAFARVYPVGDCPDFSEAVFGDRKMEDSAVQAHQATVDAGFMEGPRLQ